MENLNRSSLFIFAACFLWALDLLVRYPLTLKISLVHIMFVESLLGLFIVLPWLVSDGITSLQKMSRTDWLLAVLVGIAAMLICSLCAIVGKKLLRNHGPVTVVVLRWIFAFIFSAVFLAMDKTPLNIDVLMDLDVIWRFAFIGLISGTLSMYLYYQGMKELSATKIRPDGRFI